MKNFKKNAKDFFYQISHFTLKQFLLMLIGNLILALGLAMFTNAALGNHTFHTMIYALSGLIVGDAGFYGTLFWIINILLFVIVMLAGRKYIGLGSIINMFFLGYTITFFSYLLSKLGLDYRAADTYLVEAIGLQSVGQLIFELAATVFLSLGIAVYVGGDLGSAPYDALPLLLQNHGVKNFAVARIICDLSCFILTIVFQLLIGFSDAPIESRIGLGSVITAFCTGPLVRFFQRTIVEKIK